jgi:hypothetical protein
MTVGVKFKGRLFSDTANLSPGTRSLGALPDCTVMDLKCAVCQEGMEAKSRSCAACQCCW